MRQPLDNDAVINFSGFVRKSFSGFIQTYYVTFRICVALGFLIGVFVPLTGEAHGPLSLLGVNLAGAEFNPAKLPGKDGTDFTFPTKEELQYYAGQGLNLIRLPVLWERLQPTEFGALNAEQVSAISTAVQSAADHGMKVIIDIHNYGSGFGHPIGSPETSDRAFADFWGKLAKAFVSDPNVIFGLMNEPHVQTPEAWLPAANAAIAAIRKAGARQEILVPGTDWDGAWTFVSSGNAATLGGGIEDPGNNYVFEVHQYLDSDGSGTHAQVVSADIGPERLAAVTKWAEDNDQRLFLGEFGVAADPVSLAALRNLLLYMTDHSQVWQGGAFWSGGAWWHGYPFSVEPANGRSKPQMAVLRAYTDKG